MNGTGDGPDQFAWLEEVEGERALEWVRERNRKIEELMEKDPNYETLRNRALEMYNDESKIPYPSIVGDMVYNFWTDAYHERGVLRRATLDSYLKAKPEWEEVLDVDRLAEEEKENWVFAGTTSLETDRSHRLVKLSRGGGDAVVIREFNTDELRFIEDGFVVSEAKTNVTWIDRDTLYIGTDFGPGSLTSSGYPRTVRRWRRGEELENAETIFEGEPDDVLVTAYVVHTPGRDYHIIHRGITFYNREIWVMEGDQLLRLDLPDSAQTLFFRDRLLLLLQEGWEIEGQHYPAGSLLDIPYESFRAGDRAFRVVLDPGERGSITGIEATKDYLVLSLLENVRGKVVQLQLEGDAWEEKEIQLPGFGTPNVFSTSIESNRFMIAYEDFLTPTSLYYVDGTGHEPYVVRKQADYFDTEGLVVDQHEAISADGTEIPYFVIRPRELNLEGTAPTILYGYGGFNVPQLPVYNGGAGMGWLEKGGVFVIANIRGGGEFGPNWHRSALKENRQRSYDDFIAVAEDLIARKITSPRHLGIRGGSNGGLLVGAVYTQRPELFNAVVCDVPLLDMRNYHRLLAGASWMAEYGDPDNPEEWDYISRYSPYHNLHADRTYPEVLFMTSTRDDRVHPGHARKMAALMEKLGHLYYYYENMEGGHAGAANNRQIAMRTAIAYTYFTWKLM